MTPLKLTKGQETFVIAYDEGDESAVLDALVDMVHRRELNFDWFDAAVMSHQLGQHMAAEIGLALRESDE